MIPDRMRVALYVQFFYAALVIVWQVVGVALIWSGRPALGPTASLSLALQALVLAVLYAVALRRSPLLFVGLCAFSAIAAGASIWNSLTLDPGLWASEASRYLSIVVNSVGVAGLFVSVVAYLRWRAEPGDRSESVAPNN